MRKTINVGLIGFGRFAFKRVASFAKNPNVKIVSLYDPSARARAECAKSYSHIHLYQNFDLFLNVPNIDLYIISSPNNEHYHQCSKLLLNSANILCEKPISLLSSECLSLEDIYSKTESKVLCMGSNLSYFPSYILLLSFLEDQKIDLDSIKIEIGHKLDISEKDWRLNKDISGGGTLIDNGVHAICFLSKFVENINFSKVIKMDSTESIERDISLKLNSDNCQNIVLSSTWQRDIGYSKICIEGENLKVTANAFDDFITIQDSQRTYRLESKDNTQSIDKETELILEKLRAGKEFTNIRTAHTALKVIEECYASLDTDS